MTTNTIVQLARFNSTDKASNAEWTTKIREPIILNEGDTLSVRRLESKCTGLMTLRSIRTVTTRLSGAKFLSSIRAVATSCQT